MPEMTFNETEEFIEAPSFVEFDKGTRIAIALTQAVHCLN